MQETQIYPLVAYRTTGKDTLYKMLTGQIKFNWLVYAVSEDVPCLPFTSSLQRVAFADKLKEDVIEFIKVKYPSILEGQEDPRSWLEKRKDEPLLPDSRSYRDLLIEYAAIKRKEKTTYWSERALEGKKGQLIITDCRYLDEIEGAKKHGRVITIRLFRSSVPIPDMSIESEHSLDKLKTDYLLVLSHEEFKKAIELWPQYSNFVQIA